MNSMAFQVHQLHQHQTSWSLEQHAISFIYVLNVFVKDKCYRTTQLCVCLAKYFIVFMCLFYIILLIYWIYLLCCLLEIETLQYSAWPVWFLLPYSWRHLLKQHYFCVFTTQCFIYFSYIFVSVCIIILILTDKCLLL